MKSSTEGRGCISLIALGASPLATRLDPDFMPRYLSILIVACLNSGIASGQNLDIDSIVSAIMFQRGKLIDGHYVAEGRETRVNANNECVLKPFRIESRFSFPAEKMFFKHVGVFDNVLRDGKRTQAEVFRLIGLFPEGTYHYTDNSPRGMALIMPPRSLKCKDLGIVQSAYLDPRCVGLLRAGATYRGTNLEAAIKEFSTKVLDGFTIEKVGGEIIKLTRVYPPNGNPGSQGGRQLALRAREGIHHPRWK